ncbi:MAG: hypothetical protein AAGA66_01225 [Bacteroidota bacterium]
MTPLELAFIEQTIDANPKPFYYYRDQYALQLIKYHVKDGMKINELKNSRYQNLLSKSVIREVLKGCGGQVIRPEALHDPLTEDGKEFNYTLSKWGEFIPHRNDPWHQTTRPGLSLVLQLNFDPWHNYQYHRLIKADGEEHPFVFDCHPVSTKRQLTMAWARLDIDLDRGEVLIEEIQNDWLREVATLYKDWNEWVKDKKKGKRGHWFFDHYRSTTFCEYVNFLKPYQKMWDEATLSMAIHFAKHELGIGDIYCHDFDSGNLLKGLEYGKPPRSLYTKLPKRFCFEQTDRAPEMIRREKYVTKPLRKNEVRWWKLSV